MFGCYFIGILPNYMNRRGILYLRVLLLCKFGDFAFLMCIKNVVLMVQCDQIGLVYFGRVIGFCCNVYVRESVSDLQFSLRRARLA